jgi:hypothetical protein
MSSHTPATHKVEIRRLDGTSHSADKGYLEMKDPSVIRMEDGSYQMYCSLGTSTTQQWVVGRFAAEHPGGPWQELPHAQIENVAGAEVCAPAVVLTQKDGNPLFEMYVQTTCFSPDGVIAYATSEDGQHFKGADKPAMTCKELTAEDQKTIISLYDVGMSEFALDGKIVECMVFSGYRQIGCGDVFMSLREKAADGAAPQDWSQPLLILKQEDVPFHNKPGSDNFEWGLEGVKIDKLADDAYLMTGVCFLDEPNEARGTRQRVFFAAAASPSGPYIPMRTPLEPTAYPEGKGENGHPDTVDLGDALGLLYQERAGEGKPWHLRYTEMKKADLLAEVRAALQPSVSPVARQKPPSP